MNIIEATSRNSLLIEQLLGVWESSVKATHLFLSESEIEEIKEYVPQALKEGSMNIWDLKFIEEQSVMSKEIHTHFYT